MKGYVGNIEQLTLANEYFRHIVYTAKSTQLYSPPHHRDGVVHKTKQEAMNDSEHFDGKIME